MYPVDDEVLVMAEFRELVDALDYHIRTKLKLETPIDNIRYELAINLKDALYNIVISIEEEQNGK